MPILLLSRPKSLTPEEIKALPKGCFPVEDLAGVVARADIDLPLGGLLGYAVAMGRAVPDALFSVEDVPVVEPVATADAPVATVDAADVITETDPWKLVDERRPADAERVFAAGNGLDPAGRERCRLLLASGDPLEVALGCRIARLTNWKSIVVNLRPLLRHDHPAVRRDAVEAIGKLAGPSMAAAVRPLAADPDAEVKAAALDAIARLGG